MSKWKREKKAILLYRIIPRWCDYHASNLIALNVSYLSHLSDTPASRGWAVVALFNVDIDDWMTARLMVRSILWLQPSGTFHSGFFGAWAPAICSDLVRWRNGIVSWGDQTKEKAKVEIARQMKADFREAFTRVEIYKAR